MKYLKFLLIVITLLTTSILAHAATSTTVNIYLTANKGVGKKIGTVEVTQTPYGLLFTPHVCHLSPGPHGFHIHEKPDCGDEGKAALGHYDPRKTDEHLGPYQKGHLGDLPVLYVNANGCATTPVLAPRLRRLGQITGRSLMIHEHGDNYSDSPEKLGGGGARTACGIIR